MRILQQKLVLFALTSLALHAVLLLIVSRFSPKPEPIKIVSSAMTTVRITPEYRIKPKQGSGATNPSAKSDRSGPGRSQPKAARTLKYADLLNLPPAELSGVGIGGARDKTPYHGDKMGELLAEASDFSANFDLPLVFRRSITEGRAWARLVLIDNGIIIKYLDGKPEIRAALFETLKTSASYKTLLSAFRYFGTDKLKISIEYETRFVSKSSFEFKTERKVYENELEITIRRYTQAPKYGVTGMVLDDEHSRRAKKRDKRHWSRLINSVAFGKTVRNYKLSIE